MDFRRNYEILELVAEGETRTFRARQISTGRPVLVHQLLDRTPSGQTNLISMVLGFVRKAPPESLVQVLDMVDHENSTYIVMGDSPEFRNFRQWLESEIQKLAIFPAPGTKAQEPSKAKSLESESAAVPRGQERFPEQVSVGAVTRTFRTRVLKGPPADAGGSKKPFTSPRVVEKAVEPPPPQPRSRGVEATPGQRSAVKPPVETAPGPGEFTRLFHAPEQPKASKSPAAAEKPIQPAAPAAAPASSKGPGEFTSLFHSQEPPKPSKAPLSTEKPSPPAVRAASPASPEGPGEFTRLFHSQEPPKPSKPLLSSERPSPLTVPPPASPGGPGEFTRLFQSPGQVGLPQRAPVAESKPTEPSPPPPAPPARPPGEYTRLFGGPLPAPGAPQPASPQPPPASPAQASMSPPAMPPLPKMTPPAMPPSPKMAAPPMPGAPPIAAPSPAAAVSGVPKAPQVKAPDTSQLKPGERPSYLPLIIILGSVFLLALGLVIYFVLKH